MFAAAACMLLSLEVPCAKCSSGGVSGPQEACIVALGPSKESSMQA